MMLSLESQVTSEAHVKFIENMALTKAPSQISTLFKLLNIRGDLFVSPDEREAMNPFLIPISKPNDRTNATLCFVRWPTPQDDSDMQLVYNYPAGIELAAMSTEHMCRRITCEMDFYGEIGAKKAVEILNHDGMDYKSGDYLPYLKSGKFPAITTHDLRLVLDRYLLTKVGPFPDCYERLALNFKDKNDIVSSLVTCERAVSLFYGFGHPVSFHAKLLREIGREIESRDAAKAALGMPLWTCSRSNEDMNDLALLAGFTGAQILGEMHLYRANDSREEEMEGDNGLEPEQLALDQAAHLMDAVVMGATDGGWRGSIDIIAKKYEFAGYSDVAKFLRAY